MGLCRMKLTGVWRDALLVLMLALAVRLALALPQTQPGYMDAYYYTVGAQQLANGRGFTEPFIWNYLDDPQGLPRPSHQYWMPLASILAALSMWAGGASFRAAQIPFVLLSALLPVIAYGLAWQTSANRRHAWAVALFAIFSGFFVPFWSSPETFAPFAVFGSVCLWATAPLHRREPREIRWGLIAGLCAGLAHLTRADGVLLLLPALVMPILHCAREGWDRAHEGDPRAHEGAPTWVVRSWLWVIWGYAMVIGPWLLRNWTVTGRWLSVAGTQTIFLTDYDDLYSFGKTLDLSTYLAWGWPNILRSKLDGLWSNLLTLIAVDGLVFLAPLAALGLWLRRRERVFQAAMIYGAALYLAMSLVFTFPGVRGGMFHSSAALLPFISSAAMIGLDAMVDWIAARRATWNAAAARRMFTWGLVTLAILMSGSLYLSRLRGWNQADAVYRAIGARLSHEAAAVVMVNNPPGYVYHTGQSAIALPNGDVETLLAAARRFGARWIVLDANRPAELAGLYEQPQSDRRLMLVETFRDETGRPVYLFRLKDEG